MQKTKRTEKRKKLPLRALLMYLLLCTVVMSGVTFSKYVATASGGDGGRVAKFNISADLTHFDDTFDVPMTPQSVPFTYTLDVTNDSETSVQITAFLEEDGNLPLGFTYKKISNDGTETSGDMAKSANESGYSFTDFLEPGVDGNYIIIISWTENSDEYSYANGVAALRLMVKAEQID